MLLSRFWYLVLSVALVLVVFVLYMATAVTNRHGERNAKLLLVAASKSVGYYLRDDARTRGTALIPLAMDAKIKKGLAAASKAENLSDLKSDVPQGAKNALAAFREKQNEKGGVPFDSLWAVDIHGRVLANDNFEKGTGSEHFEMGGYAVVADAIHGWIRDDAWVFDGQIYRVVARPVETTLGGTPVGAIVGAKVVDDSYAQDISNKTGAAVAFFAEATRVASGAPPSFDKAALEVTSKDIEALQENKEYMEKGHGLPALLRETPGYDVMAMFSRMPGEAWSLGAGYVVGHRQAIVSDPWEFERLADANDKKAVPLWLLIAVAAGTTLLGLLFTIFEHTVPLHRFRRAVAELGAKKSGTEVLKPSTFRGVYKKIAANVNDALDKIAAKAGIDRGPADMESVLGPLPTQPQMSAFSVPKAGELTMEDRAPESTRSSRKRSVPKSRPKKKRALPKRGDSDSDGAPDSAAVPSSEAGPVSDPSSPESAPATEPNRGSAAPSTQKSASEPDDGGEPFNEEKQWREVYTNFVALKKKLGEPTKKLTYEKFKGTLQRNKDALVARHKCQRVKFRVYEKQGRAALKASPVK
ncbi:MAG: hypothetical protein JRI68_11745 [Deltaproteobacteria bacterium]|nr:hypothetical protein [Deltaproteobacteria bacterium]